MAIVEGTSDNERLYQGGVKSLCEKYITRVPIKYILPESERPIILKSNINSNDNLVKLPIIDFSQLQGPNRKHVITALAKACQDFGFFQLINHGVEDDVTDRMVGESRDFFDMGSLERSKYMSNDMNSPVRYGTSFNQNNDKVFCWRDFLKLTCHPLPKVLSHWPPQLREAGSNFSKKTKKLYLILMEAIMESLGLKDTRDFKNGESCVNFEEGSQIIVINCYPWCPEPELTLGMTPHSDFGFLTLLFQANDVSGLQIHHEGTWVEVEPRPDAFVVNVGDHLEIFSNGRYKSVLHRAIVNSKKSRISIASLHSLPFNCMVSPSPNLIDQTNPKRYKDTDVQTFLNHIASREHINKNFLDSRKLTFSSSTTCPSSSSYQDNPCVSHHLI